MYLDDNMHISSLSCRPSAKIEPSAVPPSPPPVAPPPPPDAPRVKLTKLERRLPRRLVVNATESSPTSLRIRVELQSVIDQRKVSTQALVDSGATSLGYADADFVAQNGIPTTRLQRPIPVFNVDGSPNEAGSISAVVDVVLGHEGHSERVVLSRH